MEKVDKRHTGYLAKINTSETFFECLKGSNTYISFNLLPEALFFVQKEIVWVSKEAFRKLFVSSLFSRSL